MSHASIDSTILGPYPLLAPSQADSTIIHPSAAHLRTRTHPTRPKQTLDSALRNRQALYYLYYGIVPPGPSLASRRQRLDIQQGLHVRRPSFGLRTLLRTRCRNRPVHLSRRLVREKSYRDDLALRFTLDAPGSGKRS